MPKSKKRVKSNTEEAAPVYKNILKRKLSKVIIVLLALGFVGGIIATLVINMIQILSK